MNGRQEPVRVMLLISTLEYGGAQRQVIEVANHLDRQRFEVHVCSLSDYVPLGEQLHDREHRLHIVCKKHRFDVTVVPRLARLCRRLRIDILHSYLFDADIAARLAGRLAGTPVVINSERNTDYHFKRRHLLAYGLTRRWVDCVIANSHAGAEFNRRSLGMDSGLYRVIHNGVDTERFQPRPRLREAVRGELGIPPGAAVVGMFASFKPQKNHALFFHAAALIRRQIPHLHLLLVGDILHAGMMDSDEYKRRMDALVERLELRDICTFAGNRPDVERLYPACDVTVLSSLYEGTPNVLLESMACGIPVVATDVADNRLLVPDGRCGFLVPPDSPERLCEALVPLLGNNDLRGRLAEEARRWVCMEFSLARLAEKTMKVYLETIDRKN